VGLALFVLRPVRMKGMVSGIRLMAPHTMVLAGGSLLVSVGICWWLAFYRASTQAISCLVYTTTPCELIASTSELQGYVAYRPFIVWIGLGCLAIGLIMASQTASRSDSQMAK